MISFQYIGRGVVVAALLWNHVGLGAHIILGLCDRVPKHSGDCCHVASHHASGSSGSFALRSDEYLCHPENGPCPVCKAFLKKQSGESQAQPSETRVQPPPAGCSTLLLSADFPTSSLRAHAKPRAPPIFAA